MAEFYPADNDWHVEYFRKKASTAFASGAMVAFETNSAGGDPIEPADASDTALLGIGIKTVASGDSDYADNTRYPVLVPSKKGAGFYGEVGTGTLTVADEGLLVDLASASTVNQSASAVDVLLVKQFVSASKGIFSINKPSIV